MITSYQLIPREATPNFQPGVSRVRCPPAAKCPKDGGHPASETVVVDLELTERLHGTSWKGHVVSTWDMAIFNEDANVDFLDDLADLDFDETVQAVRDACLLAGDKDNATEEDILNGLSLIHI